MTQTINGALYAKLQGLLGTCNMELICSFEMKGGATTWTYKCILKSIGFPTKLRAKIISAEETVLGTSKNLEADSADEVFTKAYELICTECAEIDIYEYINNSHVWGKYSHYIGVWKYNPGTDKIEKTEKKGTEYYDPEEDK